MNGTFEITYPDFLDVETCCGAMTIEGFPFEGGIKYYEDYIFWEPECWEEYEKSGFKGPDSKEYVKTYIEKVQTEIATVINRMSNIGFFSVYINDHQREVLDSMLKDIGFEEVSYAYNGNSGNMIYMYVFSRKIKSKRKTAKTYNA